MKTLIMILLIYFLLSACSKRYYLTPKKSHYDYQGSENRA